MDEKRSCENCGNTRCANSIVAFCYDDCVSSNYQRNWKPIKKHEEIKKSGSRLSQWIIDECDTTDETPSRAWIEFHCPNCGSNFGLEEGQYGWYAPESEIPFKVCPICGLSMDDRGGIKDE